MIQSIDSKARKLSRITHEDTSIIDSEGVNIAAAVDEPAIIRLCERFFQLIDEDDEKWFTDIYAKSEIPREELIQGYYEYLIQRLGGAPHYSERAGHPNLISLHAEIGIDNSRKNKWLSLMEDALDSLDHIFDSDLKNHLMLFFSHCCSTYVVGSNELKRFTCARLYDDDFEVNRAPDPDDKVIKSSEGVERHHHHRK